MDTYAEHVADLIDMLDNYEACHECGGDSRAHDIAPDMFGNPHAWCRTIPDGPR